jgi:hypothetical protein
VAVRGADADRPSDADRAELAVGDQPPGHRPGDRQALGDLLEAKQAQGRSRTVDPFDWTADRLLLAESFARLDLGDRAATKQWFIQHGAVDGVDFNGGAGELPDDNWLEDRGPLDLADHLGDVHHEQDNVSWHLTALARLSAGRSNWEWDPSWGRLVIDSPDGDFIVGGPNGGAKLMSGTLMDYLGANPSPGQELVRELDKQATLRAATDAWPIIRVGPAAWFGYWRQVHGPSGLRMNEETIEKAKVLGSTWDEAVELERLLISPYVAQAAERRFTIEREQRDVDGATRSVVVTREERIWQSILAPIYLQLLEALRRITEDEPGAATCRECGRPFLVLDARRRFFCNDRERSRFSQRERRKRIAAAEDALTINDSVTVEVVRGGREP